jgi:hypothetical protein
MGSMTQLLRVVGGQERSRAASLGCDGLLTSEGKQPALRTPSSYSHDSMQNFACARGSREASLDMSPDPGKT